MFKIFSAFWNAFHPSTIFRKKFCPFVDPFAYIYTFRTSDSEIVRYFFENIASLRSSLDCGRELSNDLLVKLHGTVLIEKAEKYHQKLQTFNRMVMEKIMKAKTIGESCDAWKIYLDEQHIPNQQYISRRLFSTTAKLSLLMDPKTKGGSLNNDQRLLTCRSLLKELKDPEEYKVFSNFLKGTGEFADPDMQDIDGEMFWELMSTSHKKLSALGMKYTSFPAIIRRQQHRSSRFHEVSEKQLFVREMLK